MLSWEFATEGVCVCAGASCCESRYERGEGVLKRIKGASKRTTVMQAREPTVDLAALDQAHRTFSLLRLG